MHNLQLFKNTRSAYKKLQKHLDQQPVGFPATVTGIELKLLQEMFTPEEANLALCMNYKMESIDTILQKAVECGYDQDNFYRLIDNMEKKGCIFVTYSSDQKMISLHPFVVGMFEMQIPRLTPGFYLNTRQYMLERFAIEYLTSEIPQMRVIPIQKSIATEQHVMTYDEIKQLVEDTADHICVTDCICKVGKDLISQPCQITSRRKICLGFRDFADMYIRNGWGEQVTKEQTMEILDQNEKEGLILITSSSQEPQFVCSCCSCCCGIVEMISLMPRPVDFTANNYYATCDIEACNGCQRCLSRCHMGAIQMNSQTNHVAFIDNTKCIGCGLCVSTCKPGALTLIPKKNQFVPPQTIENLYDELKEKKLTTFSQISKFSKALLGMKV